MTDLHRLTVADLPEACAFVAARYHATLTYDTPVWTILAPSGRRHEGFTLAEAVTWFELREPRDVPLTCAHCGESFDFNNPWTYDAGSYFHNLCLKSAWAEWDQCRMEAEFELWSGR